VPPHTTSDSPPPFKPGGKSEEHTMRADCSAAFASITATMKAVGSDVKGMRSEVGEIGKSQAALEQSTRGLWHEIRDELQPTVQGLPDRISDAINAHGDRCPARRKAMRRAESDSDDAVDVRDFRDDPTGQITPQRGLIRNSANGHYEIPRPVLWVGGLIGAAVAASGYVIHLLTSM